MSLCSLSIFARPGMRARRLWGGHFKPVGWLWGLECAFRSGCRQCPATIASTFEPGSDGRCGRRAREARRAVGEAGYLVDSERDGALKAPLFARRCVTARDALWCAGPQLLSDQEELRRPRHVRGGARSGGNTRARGRPPSSPKPQTPKPHAT
jgi:hypothetical protein